MSDPARAEGRLMDQRREVREAYERGKRHADAHVAMLRHSLRRWRMEAEHWKAEWQKEFDQHCAFVAEMLARSEEIVRREAALKEKELSGPPGV